MDAKVEMDHVPLSITEPDIHVLHSGGRGAAVGGRTMHIDLACKRLAHRLRVAARNGVADEQDARQLGIVLDEVPGI